MKDTKTFFLEKANELNIPRRNKMERVELEKAIKDTVERYKEIIFGSDSPDCKECLDELKKQRKIDEHTYDKKLMEQTLRDFGCQYTCSHRSRVIDGGMTVCTDCGLVLEECLASDEGDFDWSHKVRRR